MGHFTNRIACACLAGLLALPAPAVALGPDDYVGTVALLGTSFCPKNTLEANGKILPISSFANLFSVFGARFGGDGRSNFGLPNLTSKVPQSGMIYCVVVTGNLPPRN